MNKLELQLQTVKDKCNLLDWQVDAVRDAIINHSTGALNVAKILIEKRETPENIRKFMAQHGLTYDGVKKLFK